MPPELHSALEELTQLLPDVAAALRQASPGPAPLDIDGMQKAAACCDVLVALLTLCSAGLGLAEGAALRLLTVGALPLGLDLSGESSVWRSDLLRSCCAAVAALLEVGSPGKAQLPPRAVAAARRTTLRPLAVASWLSHTAAAFARLGPQGQTWDMVSAFLVAAQAAIDVDVMPALLQPDAQEALVSLAADGMAASTEQERLAEESNVLAASVSVAMSLPVGRLRHGQSSRAGLLPAAADALAARLEAAGRQEQHVTAGAEGAAGTAGAANAAEDDFYAVVYMLTALMSALIGDGCETRPAGGPAHPELLQATVAALPGLLAALHRLSDLVDQGWDAAGAAGAVSRGGGRPAAAGGGSSHREGRADALTEHVAVRLVRDPSVVQGCFQSSLVTLTITLALLDGLKLHLPSWSGPDVCAAASAAADSALRLLPRLRRWPLVAGRAAGAAVVPAQTQPRPGSAGITAMYERNPPQALGVTLCALSFTLCATAANTEVCDDAATLAAFHAAIAACKWEWWQAGQEGASAFFPPDHAGEPTPVPMHPACLAAQRALQRQQWALGDTSESAERAAEIQRRLDCLLITYIEALGARPAGMSPKDVVQPRMLALCNWSDWLHGAAGTDLVLADGCRGARLLMQTFANALADRSCANQIAVGTLNWVLQRSQPSLLPVAAATPDLLRQLARLVAQPSLLGPAIEDVGTAPPDLFAIARSLLKWLQQCARESRTAAGGGGGTSSTASKLIAADVDTSGQQDLADLLRLCSRSPLPADAMQLPQPAAGADELALRRARALALRTCANPACTQLAGDSEAALKGRRCSGCRLVRYCCEGCSKQDWQKHKRACRLLSQGTVGS